MGIPTNIKVGFFVIAGLAAAALVTFLIGDQHGLFATKDTYYAAFSDVQGLGRGAPVRMGGVDVGSVARVGYSDDLKDTELKVEIRIYSADADRVRGDTTASIANKGLLGDKMLVLSVGDPKTSEALKPGSVIPSVKTQDLESLVDDAKQIVTDVKDVAANLKKATATLANAKFQEDLQNLIASLNDFFTAMDSGKGYISKLLHDPVQAQHISTLVSNADVASANLANLLAQLDVTTQRINTGPGFVHSLIYSDQGDKTLTDFGKAADEFALTLHDIREGDGLAHALLFGDDDQQQLMGNLNEITGDMAAIMNDIRAGKGTVGALLLDPSVYEDIKMLLGNVSRNRTLRALVRYSIEQDEKTNPVKITDPEALTAPNQSTP
jgi:phospholipid/cholesterol/gamma-HCH transport system substrate-binding protein